MINALRISSSIVFDANTYARKAINNAPDSKLTKLINELDNKCVSQDDKDFITYSVAISIIMNHFKEIL